MSRHIARPLARLLDAPHLDRVVPTLPAETLHRVISQYGLDACSHLLALATPEQLTSVCDLDLWRPREAGCQAEFDGVRFGEWIEMLVEADVNLAARTVAAMDPHLVVTGLARFVRVFDPVAIAPFVTLDGERLEPLTAAAASPCADIGGYHVVALRAESWDAIVVLLLALEAEHERVFHAIMGGCRQLSNSRPEYEDPDTDTSDADQLAESLATSRTERRSRQGYVDPAEARAFLQAARAYDLDLVRSSIRHPLAAEHLADGPAEQSAPLGPEPSIEREAIETQEAFDALHGVLDDLHDDRPSRPRALLTGRVAPPDSPTHVRDVIDSLAVIDPSAVAERMAELAFLANVLIAGCSFQGRAFTPQEASGAATATCNLGLDWLATFASSAGGDVAPDFVTAFHIGWRVGHNEVVMRAASGLRETLAIVRGGDSQTHAGILELRHALARHQALGTPWRVHDALDVVAVLDVPTWKGLLGVLGECPTIPAIVDALLDGRRGATSATDYTFVATMAQVARVSTFITRLPDFLAQ